MNEKLQQIIGRAMQDDQYHFAYANHDIYIIQSSSIPFILVVPQNIKNHSTLAMESNNLETNNIGKLLEQGLFTAYRLVNVLKQHHSPVLVPILPSEKDEPYYQQLSKECFNNDRRFDLQVVEIIEKAQQIIKCQNGIDVNNKIFLNGYSSSGVFAQRFSLIHPEIIDTVCIGGASCSIPLPTDKIGYPLGIRDFEELFNKKFDYESYRKIRFRYYVGSLECDIKTESRTDENGNPAPLHDMSYFDRSIPREVGKIQRAILGIDMVQRANQTIDFMKSNGFDIEHEIIDNRAHNDRDAKELIQNNLNIDFLKGVNEEGDKIIDRTYSEMLLNHQKKENSDLSIEFS